MKVNIELRTNTPYCNIHQYGETHFQIIYNNDLSSSNSYEGFFDIQDAIDFALRYNLEKLILNSGTYSLSEFKILFPEYFI